MNRHENAKPREEEARATWLEWAASGVGLFLAVGGVAFILWSGLTSGNQSPNLHVQVREILERRSGYAVTIGVVNGGGQTAAGVVVEGELVQDGQTVETSEITFDYIPGHSERRGGLLFSRDPQQFELKLRPKGYTEP